MATYHQHEKQKKDVSHRVKRLRLLEDLNDGGRYESRIFSIAGDVSIKNLIDCIQHLRIDITLYFLNKLAVNPAGDIIVCAYLVPSFSTCSFDIGFINCCFGPAELRRNK